MAIDESQDVWLISTDQRQLSPSAQQIINYGELVCRCGWIASIMIIIMSAVGSAYIDESRLLTFVFFGIAPAAIIYMTGFLLRLILLWVGAVYDVIHPHVQETCRVISQTTFFGWQLLNDHVAKLDLCGNLVLRPTEAGLKIAKAALARCVVDAFTLERLRRFRRDAYRNFVYVSMFPVRQSAQLLIRILERKHVHLSHGYPRLLPKH